MIAANAMPAGAPAEASTAVPPPASDAATAAATPAAWTWSVGQVDITGRDIDLAAWSPARQIQSWSLQAAGLTNRPDAPEASLALEATEQAGEGHRAEAAPGCTEKLPARERGRMGNHGIRASSRTRWRRK